MGRRTDIQKVIFDWFRSVSGMDDQSIVWSHQSHARPDRQFAELRLFSWISQNGMMEQHSADPSYPAEVIDYGGNGTFVLSIFIQGVNGSDPVPFDILESVQVGIADDAKRLLLQRAHTDIIKIAHVHNSTTYTITIDKATVTYLSDSSATALEIRNGLKAAVNAKSWLAGVLVASDGAANDLLVLTGIPGCDFTVSVDSEMLITSHTGAVDLSIVRNFGINDLTDHLETKSESRAQMDIKFEVSQNLLAEIEMVQTVEGTVQGEAFNYPL